MRIALLHTISSIWHHRLNGHEFEQTSGDGEGQGSLVYCSPWGCKGPDTTERLNNYYFVELLGSWKAPCVCTMCVKHLVLGLARDKCSVSVTCTERLSNLPHVTQPGNDKARFHTQASGSRLVPILLWGPLPLPAEGPTDGRAPWKEHKIGRIGNH